MNDSNPLLSTNPEEHVLTSIRIKIIKEALLFKLEQKVLLFQCSLIYTSSLFLIYRQSSRGKVFASFDF